MNPITAVRELLEAAAEGHRMKAFGHDYREKEAAAIAQAEREREAALGARQTREQSAKLFPHKLRVDELVARDAEVKKAQRIFQAIQHGHEGTDAGDAEHGAHIEDAARQLDIDKTNASISADQALEADRRQRLPSAPVPEDAQRLLSGAKDFAGPLPPMSNAAYATHGLLEAQEDKDLDRRERGLDRAAQLQAAQMRASGGGEISPTQLEITRRMRERFGEAPLPQGVTNSVSAGIGALSILDSMEGQLPVIQGIIGPATGRMTRVRSKIGLTDAAEERGLATIQQYFNKLGELVSGKVITENEMIRLQRELQDETLTPVQFKARMAVQRRYINDKLHSYRLSQNQYLRPRIDEMLGQAGVDIGRDELMGDAGAAPTTQAGSEAPVRVNTPEEAEALPSGTLYIRPDGRVKRRP